MLIPRLLEALHRARVEYVVIGGYALAAHGYVRGTDDLDVVPGPDRRNLQRLADAVEDLEGVPVEIAGGLRPEVLRAGAKRVDLPGIGAVWFVGRDQLVRMKQRSDRLRDKADVEELLRRDERT